MLNDKKKKNHHNDIKGNETSLYQCKDKITLMNNN